jgi:hypothetical protein
MVMMSKRNKHRHTGIDAERTVAEAMKQVLMCYVFIDNNFVYSTFIAYVTVYSVYIKKKSMENTIPEVLILTLQFCCVFLLGGAGNAAC